MDITTRVGEWITDGIGAFFQNILDGLINSFINVFTENLSNMYGIANHLLNSTYVSNTIILIQGIALSVLACRIATQALTTYILWQNGEVHDSKNLLWEAVSGGFMIYASPWLCRWIFNLGSVLAEDIASTIGYSSNSAALSTLLVVTGGAALSLIFLALVWVVLFVVILIQASVRAVELTLLAVSGPMLTIKGINADLTATWIRNVLVISLTQAVQIFLIKGLLVTMADFLTFNDGFGLILSIGFLMVCYRTPNILKEYTYSTGISQGIGGAAQQAGSMALMRKAFTRV